VVKNIVNSYSYLALLGDIAIIIAVLWFKRLRQIIGPYSYHLAFFLSLIATLASLFLSEVAKFQPCILCWYQRIAMYPQPLLYYIALIRKERVLKPYLLVVNIIGAGIALYHYLLQVMPKSLFAPCNTDLTGVSVSCVKGYKFYFGFMSFPLMALTVFVLLIILLSFTKAEKAK